MDLLSWFMVGSASWWPTKVGVRGVIGNAGVRGVIGMPGALGVDFAVGVL